MSACNNKKAIFRRERALWRTFTRHFVSRAKGQIKKEETVQVFDPIEQRWAVGK